MAEFPPIFIPFFGDVSDAPMIRALHTKKVPFTLVTHASNAENARKIAYITGERNIRLIEQSDGSYANLLNAIRFMLAPHTGWFWLLHPQVCEFFSVSSGRQRKVSPEAEQPALLVSDLDTRVALQYRFPVLQNADASQEGFALVDLAFFDASSLQKIDETEFVDPPFALCINNTVLPTSVQFRGYYNEVRDFKLQVLAAKLIISTPFTFATGFYLRSQLVPFYNRLKQYGLDIKNIDDENLTFQARWGSKICQLRTNSSLHGDFSETVRMNTTLFVHWNGCQPASLLETNVPGKLAKGPQVLCDCAVCLSPQASRRGFYLFPSLNQESSKKPKLGEDSWKDSAENMVPGEAKKNRRKQVHWADMQHVEQSQGGHPIERENHDKHVDESSSNTTEVVSFESESSQVDASSELPANGSLGSEASDSDISQANILAVSQSREVQPITTPHSQDKLRIAHIMDDIRGAVGERSSDGLPPEASKLPTFLVGIIFNVSDRRVEVSWNKMHWIDTLDDIADIRALLTLFGDKRIAKIGWGTYDLYATAMKTIAADEVDTFLPHNVHDISLAAFYLGKLIESQEDILKESAQLASENAIEKESTMAALFSLFNVYARILYQEHLVDSFRAANHATFALALMEVGGVCLQSSAIEDVQKKWESLIGSDVLSANLHSDLVERLHFLSLWAPLVAAKPSSEKTTQVRFGFRQSLYSGRVLVACRADDLFCYVEPDSSYVSDSPNDSISISSIGKAVIAPYGMRIILIEYDTIELQIFASLAQDTSLAHLFERDIDVCSFLACAVKLDRMEFHDALSVYEKESISAHFRAFLQTLIQGCLYGTKLSALALTTRRKWEEVQAFVRCFHSLFPSIEQYREKIANECIMNGEVQTLGGARSLFPPKKNSYAGKCDPSVAQAAIDFLIQGSIANCMNSILASLVALRASIRPTTFHLAMQAHDAIILYIDERFIDEVAPMVLNAASQWGKTESKMAFTVRFGHSLNAMQTIDHHRINSSRNVSDNKLLSVRDVNWV